MTRLLAVALVAAWALLPTAATAHEGHEHTIMGIVQKTEDGRVEVRSKDEKSGKETVLSIRLDEKTEVWRGEAKAVPADIKTGERIVVKYVTAKAKDGQETHTAKQVRLAAPTL